MEATITITNAGTDVGPFNLYSDVDGYVSAFAFNVPLADLEAGYVATNIPDGTTMVRVQSFNLQCTNYQTEPMPTTTTTTTTV
jgi:hypothetical protein